MKKWVIGLNLVFFMALPAWMPITTAQSSGQAAVIGHPSLFFTADDLDQLRAQAQTTHRDIWTTITAFADSKLGTLPPETAPPDGIETEYRNWGNEIIAFAFACAITVDPDYCDLARDYLLTYVQWDQWDFENRRDLGLAHMLMGSSLAYDWIYNYLTPAERGIAYTGLARWGEAMYQAAIQGHRNEWANWWTDDIIQNHHWINNSALGIAGLALAATPPDEIAGNIANCTISSGSNVNMRSGPSTADDVVAVLPAGQSVAVDEQILAEDGYIWWHTSEGLWIRSDVVREGDNCALVAPAAIDPQLWVDHAAGQFERVQALLNGIGDGTWHEGIHYQNYALVMSMPFLENLRAIEGIDLFPHDYMQNYTYWRIYNYLPQSVQFIMAYGNFEWDWGNSYNAQSLLRWTSREYDDPYAQWMADQMVIAGRGRGTSAFDVPFAVYEFLFYDPDIAPQPPDDLPNSRVFPDLEGVIWRTGWEDSDTVFGLKTGAYGGTFAFNAFTQGTYPCGTGDLDCDFSVFHDHADANTFYIYRYGSWLAPEHEGFGIFDTQFHNTILIDRAGQFRPQEEYFGQPQYFVGTNGYLEATANTTSFNYVASDATGPYTTNIPDIEDVTRYVVYVRPGYFIMVDNIQAGQPHTYEWVSHFADSVSVEDNWIRGTPGGSQQLAIQVVAPDSFEATVGDDGYPYVRVETTEYSRSGLFVHLLHPTIDAEWDRRPIATVTEDNGSVLALNVQRQDDTNLRDEILLAYQGNDGEPIGGYAFDGQIAVITRNASGAPQKIFVSGGTSLIEQGETVTPLVTNLSPEQAFEVHYQGDGVIAISGDSPAGVTFYAPVVSTLTVNGQPWTFTSDGTYLTLEGPAAG